MLPETVKQARYASGLGVALRALDQELRETEEALVKAAVVKVQRGTLRGEEALALWGEVSGLRRIRDRVAQKLRSADALARTGDDNA